MKTKWLNDEDNVMRVLNPVMFLTSESDCFDLKLCDSSNDVETDIREAIDIDGNLILLCETDWRFE